MLKYLFISFLLLCAGTVFAQKTSILNLVQSDNVGNIKLNGVTVSRVYKGVFKQEYSTLSSDSAYIYPNSNIFDAYGHVVITQGDTLHIYADKLNYNATTKVAILTDNVRMVDKDATLTTNYLTYNTATRIGTYTGGGKLVNKDNVLTSKNGYYFALSRDSYFRYDVVLTAPDALIKTDTMRYNTGSRIAYFYGPTNIYGTKDKDTLYTENGLYNTATEQAFFGKKNLYKSGTKSLKGDSLFYDKLKGYGKAVKNITFLDTEQKMTLKGDLGEYYKATERTVVTQNAYVIFVTEQRDTTKADPLPAPPPVTKNGLPQFAPPPGATALAQGVLGTVKLSDTAKIKQAVVANSKQITEQVRKNQAAITAAAKTHLDTVKLKEALKNSDLKNRPIPTDIKTLTASAKKLLGDTAKLKPVTTPKLAANKNKKPVTAKLSARDSLKLLTVKDSSHIRIKRDSIFMSADTLETRMVIYKQLLELQEQRRLAGIKDTSVKPRKPRFVEEKPSKYLKARSLAFQMDSVFFRRPKFPNEKPPAPIDTAKRNAQMAAQRKRRTADSLQAAKIRAADPVYARNSVVLSDTSRVRILSAHYNARLFKSDLQAKADSIFYSSADSTIRCYSKPMIWTQESQLSGDTVYLQMRNKKLDNMDMFMNSFVVNLEKGDSLHFNQVGGKRMKGYFKDSKLDRVYFEGNAESIYFKRDSGKVTGLERSVSGRIYAYFNDNAATKAAYLRKAEINYIPINKATEEDKILKGFVWKPKERPRSKEDIIPSRKKSSVKKPAIKPPAGKPGTGPVKTGGTGKPAAAKPEPVAGKPANVKSTKDSAAAPVKTQINKDSLTTPIKNVDKTRGLFKDTVNKSPVKP